MYKLFLPALLLFATIPLENAYATAACGGPNVSINTRDQTSCLPKKVCHIAELLSEKYGHVSIVSALRPEADNKRRGGAKHSMHIQCRAIDFLIPNRSTLAAQRGLASTLENIRRQIGRPMRYNVYCTGRAHVDNSDLKDGYDTCIHGGKSSKKSKRYAKRYKRKTHKRRR